jgi:TPR repeat protein
VPEDLNKAYYWMSKAVEQKLGNTQYLQNRRENRIITIIHPLDVPLAAVIFTGVITTRYPPNRTRV